VCGREKLHRALTRHSSLAFRDATGHVFAAATFSRKMAACENRENTGFHELAHVDSYNPANALQATISRQPYSLKRARIAPEP
jgi:hypothetical protein